jgi:hypothetical protein
MKHNFENEKRELIKKEFAIEQEKIRLEILRETISLEKENRTLSDLNERLKLEIETLKKTKRNTPYNGEDILVSDDKKDWYLRKFSCFDNGNLVCAFKVNLSGMNTWKYWKFLDD